MKVDAMMTAQTRVTNPVAQRACHDPSLRDPARQKTARKQSRVAPVVMTDGKTVTRAPPRVAATRARRKANSAADLKIGHQKGKRQMRERNKTRGNNLIPEKGELQDYHESQRYIEEKRARRRRVCYKRLGKIGGSAADL